MRLVPNTTLTSDRPCPELECTGQSWCGARENIEGPWRMNKAWLSLDDARPGSRLLSCYGPANHSTGAVPPQRSPARQHTRPSNSQACAAEMPTTASWSQRRHPIHPTIPVHHLPAVCLFLTFSLFPRPAPRTEHSGPLFFPGSGQARELRQPSATAQPRKPTSS